MILVNIFMIFVVPLLLFYIYMYIFFHRHYFTWASLARLAKMWNGHAQENHLIPSESHENNNHKQIKQINCARRQRKCGADAHAMSITFATYLGLHLVWIGFFFFYFWCACFNFFLKIYWSSLLHRSHFQQTSD